MANATGNVKLYKLLSGSVTRYEDTEDKAGTRKVVTYEANGEAAGNLVWLNEREVEFIGLKKLEEVHGNVEGAPEAPTSVGESVLHAEPIKPTEHTEPVNVSEAMETTTTEPASSGNPAVARVLAKKAAESK